MKPSPMPFIRLSYDIDEDSPHFPSARPLERTERSSIEKGDASNMLSVTLYTHYGTHVDAPYHFHKDGLRLTDLDVNHFYFKKPLTIDIPKEEDQPIRKTILTRFEDRDPGQGSPPPQDRLLEVPSRSSEISLQSLHRRRRGPLSDRSFSRASRPWHRLHLCPQPQIQTHRHRSPSDPSGRFPSEEISPPLRRPSPRLRRSYSLRSDRVTLIRQGCRGLSLHDHSPVRKKKR